MAVASDLIAAQYRGLLSYKKLRVLTGAEAAEWDRKADHLADLLASEWYDRRGRRFYGAMDEQGKMFPSLGSPHLLAYFDAVRDARQLSILLDQIHSLGQAGATVEVLSHYPEIFFRHSQADRGLLWLEHLIHPSLYRREYPEVSFSIVGAYVTGLMGIASDAPSRTLWTINNTFPYIHEASLKNCPLFDGTIDLAYQEKYAQLTNRTGAPLCWQGEQVEDGETAESALV